MRMYDQYKSANWATILTLGLHFGCLSVPFGDFLWLDTPNNSPSDACKIWL